MEKKQGLRFLLVAFCFLLLFSVVVVATETTTEETEAEETETDSEPVETGGDRTLLDEVFDFTFQLDGKEYALPFPVADLLADGWAFDEGDEEAELQSAGEVSYSRYTLTRETEKIEVRLRSFRDGNTKLPDCQVVTLFVGQPYYSDQELASLLLPGGISHDSTIEEIVAAYGQPNSRTDYRCVYGAENSVSLSFDLDTSTGKPKQIELNRRFQLVVPEDADGLDVKPPADVASYVPVFEPDDRLANLIIEVDGKYLRFPFPLSELLSDGWSLLSAYDENTMLEPRSYVTVFLRKGTALIESSVMNLSATEKASLECCYLRSITDTERPDYGIYSQTGLTLAEGVAIGSERRDVVLLLIDLKPDVSVSGNYEEYRVAVGGRGSHLTIRLDDGLVTLINLDQYY